MTGLHIVGWIVAALIVVACYFRYQWIQGRTAKQWSLKAAKAKRAKGRAEVKKQKHTNGFGYAWHALTNNLKTADELRTEADNPFDPDEFDRGMLDAIHAYTDFLQGVEERTKEIHLQYEPPRNEQWR